MEITEQFLARVSTDFNQYAQEEGKTEAIKGTFYYFGSEIATLRLLKVYRLNPKARQGWSPNLGTYYFSLEMA